MIVRTITSAIEKHFFKGKAILLIGPRQVGKTTLLKGILEGKKYDALYLNCDEPDITQLLNNATSTELRTLIGNKKMVLIDEAQKITNIGNTLKLIVDNISGIQVIATGSSAFDLTSEINEPLTGRKYEFRLYPFASSELAAHTSVLEEKRMLPNRLIYGLYPDIVNHPGEEIELLLELINSYLFKDILSYQDIRRSAVLTKLVTSLALQIGCEVSYNELSRSIGIDKETVGRYIDLLEKSFVVFCLPAFSRNLRNELKKSKKIYFYDNGIRNALLNNFSPLSLRQDTGALWENFLVSERIKHNQYQRIFTNDYFWRTHAQQEIDLIEERNGTLYAFEFKWNPAHKAKLPAKFGEAYPQHEFKVVTPENYFEFISPALLSGTGE